MTMYQQLKSRWSITQKKNKQTEIPDMNWLKQFEL